MFQAFLKSLAVLFCFLFSSPPSSNLVPKHINLFLEIIYLFVVFWLSFLFVCLFCTQKSLDQSKLPQKNVAIQPSFEGNAPDNFSTPKRSSGGWGHRVSMEITEGKVCLTN